jgi:hypothetical protein
MKTFYFDTGVRVHEHVPPVRLPKGNVVSSNGVHLIPFDCDDVPKNATFKFACDSTPPRSEHLLKREIHNSNLVSKFAFFQVSAP